MSTLAEKTRTKQNGMGKKPLSSLKQEDKCMGCGWAKHGNGSTREREQQCTAWGKICKRCSKRTTISLSSSSHGCQIQRIQLQEQQSFTSRARRGRRCGHHALYHRGPRGVRRWKTKGEMELDEGTSTSTTCTTTIRLDTSSSRGGGARVRKPVLRQSAPTAGRLKKRAV